MNIWKKRMPISIKASPHIPWQKKLAPIIAEGLKKRNMSYNINGNEGIPMVLGPNLHKQHEIEPYLQVNRYFVGTKPNAVHETVAISWNGFNGMGQFNIDHINEDRLWKFISPSDIKEWKTDGKDYLLCDQVDNGRSDVSLNDWKRKITVPYRSRPHISRNPPPLVDDLKNVKAVLTFNSTVGVECLLHGIPVVAYDKGNPLYPFVGHTAEDIQYPDRIKVLTLLANCQYTYDEISKGNWFQRLYEPRDSKLYEYTEKV